MGLIFDLSVVVVLTAIVFVPIFVMLARAKSKLNKELPTPKPYFGQGMLGLSAQLEKDMYGHEDHRSFLYDCTCRLCVALREEIDEEIKAVRKKRNKKKPKKTRKSRRK